MANLNVFIDGSWLFRACAPEKALSACTEHPDSVFPIDFGKLDQGLLHHIGSTGVMTLGDKYISTSIFSLPENFDDWPIDYEGVTPEDISRTRGSVRARERFVSKATAAGYSSEAIYRPRIKSWILEKLRLNSYQEKQVDATVVALLVRSAITKPDDVHVVITGDADILPAIRVAYPEYSKNVFIATTHPDELTADRRQTSFSLSNFDFNIDPYYFQDFIDVIIQGDHSYKCAHCNKVFVRSRPIPERARPCCSNCNRTRS